MRGVWIPLVLLASGCTVNVVPPVDTSLGIKAFESMKVIERYEIPLALYIEPELRSYKVQTTIQAGKYTLNVGEAISVKLIKALAYRFNRIRLAENLAEAQTEEVILRVALREADTQFKAVPGFVKVKAESYMRLVLRAELRDVKTNQIVWIGTTEVKETFVHEEMMQMQYQEAGRGFAQAINQTIDHAIGDLLAQMTKSPNFREYIKQKKGEKYGQDGNSNSSWRPHGELCGPSKN